jgi:hypothetical protein
MKKRELKLKIGIIGSAGRKEDEPKMTLELYKKMVKKAHELIDDIVEEQKIDFGDVVLVSGGSAWSDHIAVDLFNEAFMNLRLHMPVKFCDEKVCFYDSLNTGYSGKLINSVHKNFSMKTGKDSLNELKQAKKDGAVFIETYNGFHDRNSGLAKDVSNNSGVLIAFSWGKDQPEKGGTYDTWKKTSGRKIHISLGSL